MYNEGPLHYTLSHYGGLVAKSCLTLVTPWTVACQAPLSKGFSRQEYWSVLPFPSPGDLPYLYSTISFFLSMSFKYVSLSYTLTGEGNGTPLQYSCLENPMDGGAWWAAVHGVAKSQRRLSHFLFSFSCIGEGNGNPLQCSCLENPRDGEPGGLLSPGSHRVGHD